MGFLYKKSRSESFRQFFSQADEFEKKFNQYKLSREKIDVILKKSFFSESDVGGVPLSWREDNELISIDQSDSHTLVIGPTGSKKTRLVAMPSVRILGSAGESMIISDPKAEIYLRTADFLKQSGYEMEVINLRNPQYSSGWNPLIIPYRFYCQGNLDRAYEFANDVAQNMMGEKGTNEPFWNESAASFLFGLIILLFMFCREHDLSEDHVTFTNIFELRNSLFIGSESQIRSSGIWQYARKDLYIRNSLIGTVETAKDTRGGILSTFDQAMRSISIQPGLMNMLSTNEINLENFFEKKHVIYLIMPDEKTSYHKLVSLFVKQSYEYFIYLSQQGIYESGIHTGFLPVRLNYILDEFSSLPAIKDFPTMITAARSRNIRFVLFIQSKHQVQQRYEEESETILTNCNNWIFLTTRELALLKDISTLCGDKDGKPVLPIAQLQRLNKEEGEVLILSGRSKPYITRLPDIDLYDKKKYEVIQLIKRDGKEGGLIDLEGLESREIENPFLKGAMSNEDIDKMIAEIDRKLKELDEEEEKVRKDMKEGQADDTGTNDSRNEGK